MSKCISCSVKVNTMFWSMTWAEEPAMCPLWLSGMASVKSNLHLVTRTWEGRTSTAVWWTTSFMNSGERTGHRNTHLWWGWEELASASREICHHKNGPGKFGNLPKFVLAIKTHNSIYSHDTIKKYIVLHLRMNILNLVEQQWVMADLFRTLTKWDSVFRLLTMTTFFKE